MKFYEAGWAAAIDRANARIQTDEKTLNGQTTPEPASASGHPKIMKNHGWDKIIACVNARIANGVTVDIAPATTPPAPGEKPESVTQEAARPTEADQRAVVIENFCGKLAGRPMGIARRYRYDARPMSIIMREIISRNLQCGAGFRGGSWIR